MRNMPGLEFQPGHCFVAVDKINDCLVVQFSTAPKPPSDEGGGTPNGVTEGEKVQNNVTTLAKTHILSLPQSKIKDF